MSEFVLTSRACTGFMVIESTELEPGELAVLRQLGNCAHFNFERLDEDTLPPINRDPLQDVALENSRPPLPGKYSWEP